MSRCRVLSRCGRDPHPLGRRGCARASRPRATAACRPDRLVTHRERADFDLPELIDRRVGTEACPSGARLVLPSVERYPQVCGRAATAVRRSGAGVEAGRLGYPHEGPVAARTDDALIIPAGARRPRRTRYRRLRGVDRAATRVRSSSAWS
jgi:hypothetical protein